MDAVAILNILLPAVFVVVGVALVWFLVELVRTLKTARDALVQLQPTLQNVEKITKELQPAIERVDPLVERVSLTVDAANLELMRVDQILENVGDISGTLSKTTNTIDSVTQAPVKMVTAVSDRVRKVITPARGSDEAARLASGSKKETAPEQAPADMFRDIQIPDVQPDAGVDALFASDAAAATQGAQDKSDVTQNQPEQRYYTYANAASAAAAVATAEKVGAHASTDTATIPAAEPEPAPAPVAAPEAAPVDAAAPTSVFAEQATGHIPSVASVEPAPAAEPVFPYPVSTLESEGVIPASTAPAETGTTAPATSIDAAVDFSGLVPEQPVPTAVPEAQNVAGISALDGLFDNLDLSGEPAPTTSAFAPIPATDAPAEDPAALADELAAAFAVPSVSANSMPVQDSGVPADAVSAFAAGSAFELPTQPAASSAAPVGAHVQSAVDAALAAARAHISTKVSEAPSDDVFGISTDSLNGNANR